MGRPKNAIPKKGESLADLHPEIISEWDYEKNEHPPSYYKPRSGVKISWKCPVADDHKWVQTPNVRTGRKTGCPFCQNLAVSVTNSLTSLYPEIASQWHPTKNGDKTPGDFVAYSAKRVWWNCPVADDHEWRTAIEKRTREGQGCPCCAFPIRKVVPSNSLASTHPLIAEQWDNQKNDKGPTEVAAGSSRKAWWVCEQGHSFSQMISNRTVHNQNCPYCQGQKVLTDGSNSLAAEFPEMIEEWDSELNHPITPWEVRPATHKKFHWRCTLESCGHRWVVSPAMRTHFGTGCPSCAKYGIDRGKPTYLYAMRIEGPTGIWWWKGGVSVEPERRARQVERSIKNAGMDLDVILHEMIEIENGELALEIENSMMIEKSIRVTSIEQFDGSSELFNRNPLQWLRDSGVFQRGAL